MINIGIGISWAKAIYSVANNVIANFKARVLSYPNSIFEAGPCLDATLEGLNAIGLLDNASLIVTPNAYTEGILYDVIPNTTLGDMTVVRATTATRVNSAGLIEVVPRNVLQYSNDLNNSVWGVSNVTKTNGQVSPTSSNNEGWLLNKTSTGVDGAVYNGFTISSLNKYTYSWYILKDTNESRFPEFYLRLNNGEFEQYIQLNTKTGALGVRIASSGCTRSITLSPDGLWWRLTLTNPAPTTNGVDNRHGVRPAAGTTLGVYNINATGSVIVYGAQTEEGSTATEYFPTTTRLNIPRIDYTNGSCPSLLVEPQRTNLVLYSQQLNNATWTKYGATTVSVSSFNSKIQGAIAYNITGLNVFYTDRLEQLVTSISGSSFTICLKAIDLADVGKTISIFGNGGFNQNYILTQDWTVISKLSSQTNTSFSISRALTGTPADKLAISFIQLELGSYPTSYIPTVASTVTRNADVISKTGISSLIGQTEGTIYAEIKVNKLIGTASRYIFHISDGTVNNRIYIAFSGASSNVIRGRIFNGGTLQCSIDSSTITTTGTYKLALAYKNNDIVFYINGVQIGVDIIATIPTCSRVDIGHNYAGASQLGDGVANANIFKTRLLNTELAQLTTL